MKENYFGKFITNYLIFLINLFLGEMIFKLISNYPILDWSTFRIFIGLNLISIILSLIISLLPRKISKIITLICIFALLMYTFLQIGFNSYLGVYMSFGTSSQFGAVQDYIFEFLSSLSWTYYLVFLPFVFTLIFCIFKKKHSKEKKTGFRKLIYLLFALILTLFSVLYIYTLNASYMQNPLQTVSNIELMSNPSIPSVAIKEFGTIGYGILDIKALIFPANLDVDEEFEPEISENSEPVEQDNSRNIDDRAWEMVIENEKNSTYNKLNKYYINRQVTPKNEYTGLFENKNLIIIMMESINDIIINEEFFPNFYKLYTEGWHFNNNYSPRNSCATGNNEMSGMTGLYSINDSCTANKYKDNTYFESIFNLFNNSGYKTTSMHDFTESYYRRSVIHKNMGSQKYYGAQALKIPYYYNYGEWASDEDFFAKVLTILDAYPEDTKFMTWLTTVSSHQPYSISSPYGDLYYRYFKNTKYNATTKRYLSKVKVLDNAIGILIDGLKERDMLDDTVIILFADHYPYGLAKSNIESVLGYKVTVDSVAEKTPLVIYNPTLEATAYDHYTSFMNLTPTIANLFNLDYDPRLYFGNDSLDPNYKGIVVFADGSWKNEHAYYNAGNSKINYYDDFYTIDDIKKINNEISMQMKMSSLSIKNNYFSYLNKNLIKYKAQVLEMDKAKELENIETNEEMQVENE